MIKVTALTSGLNVPPRRFRVEQFIRPLRELGVDVTEHCLFMNKFEPSPRPWLRPVWAAGKLLGRAPGLLASQFGDITWLEREFYPGRFTLERLTGSKRIFDVDDAIWLGGNANFSEEIASRSFGVIAGNQFIAEHYQKRNSRVWVVPTSVDTNRWQPAEKKPAPWTIGWIGSSSTLPYLYLIEDALAEFLEQHKDSTLLVVCDVRPNFNLLSKNQWQFESWSAEKEVELVQKMNVGVMPLPHSDWSRGKCSLKMLLYMAVGIPVVVSPVGHNKEVLQREEVGFGPVTTSEWFEALSLIYNDSRLAARLGRAARDVVEQHYSVQVNAKALAAIFREVASD